MNIPSSRRPSGSDAFTVQVATAQVEAARAEAERLVAATASTRGAVDFTVAGREAGEHVRELVANTNRLRDELAHHMAKAEAEIASRCAEAARRRVRPSGTPRLPVSQRGRSRGPRCGPTRRQGSRRVTARSRSSGGDEPGEQPARPHEGVRA